MRINPAIAAEVDSWLTVLQRRGHLHHVQSEPDGTWIVQREWHDRPWTLHHPVLAMDWVKDLVRKIQQQNPETSW
ncbi:hypothetical protein ACUN3E_27965 [Streptomyces sp. Ju416(a)]|uniref:hypothetical protein n=1 Tax=Streptomyces sp. Ju416(a) TaxID=3446591 RepID=UPI00403DCF55